MITIKNNRTNFGYGYPDVNYSGVTLIGGMPTAGFVPSGLSGIDLSNPLVLAGIAVAAYLAWKNKSKLGL